MIQSKSANHAKSYFSEALQKADYYMDGQELLGSFEGKLSDRLAISGIAESEAFFDLCENIHPVTGKPLTPRTKEDRTVGYDINFHVPKSVSLVHVLSKGSHILEAFQASVRDTMKDIEADGMARVRKNGALQDRKTGELLWAEFIHQTARPVDGSVPDPHLHCHCFVFNATWDGVESKFKAGQFRDIKRDMPYYQARFHKALSDKLITLGYDIRRTSKSFEIVGVPQNAIDLFSKRTNEIGEFAKEKGITDAKALGELGAKTRSKKQKGLSMEELKTEWRRQIKELGNLNGDGQNQPIRFAKHRVVSKDSPQDCVDYALNHSFERASVMPERRLLESAYRHSIGKPSASIAEITTCFENDNNVIRVKEKGRDYCTKYDVLTEEKKMVELARSGQGKFKPLYKNVTPDANLNVQQNAAIEHIMTTSNQVSIIRGAAGTGKTTIMTTATRFMEEAGKRITVVAPTAEASRGVLAAEGFKDATTVAKLLSDEEMQSNLNGQILWVDEAGLLGTKDMSALLALAKHQNARVVLGGDTRQHASVVRGDALRILNTVAGIKTAEVTKIHRQKNYDYREAVEKLSQGDVKSGFEKLHRMGAIKEIDPLKPNDDLVDDYMAAVKNKKSVLIVSPTHEQGNNVTQEVRKRLRTAGFIGKKEIVATKLSNLNLTAAQKTDWRNFQPGQIIQFNQNATKIKRGSAWAVDKVSENKIKIKNASGDEQFLPLPNSTSYEVYNQLEIGLSKGDKVRITRNSFDKQKQRLNNGQSLEIVSVTKSGEIELINKASKATYKLNGDFGHIDHAYCTTSHSAQGKTVDEVFISQPSSTFTATDAKQFYVSVSRGRDAAHIYTDDKEALLDYASEIGDRKSALELVGVHNMHLHLAPQLERINPAFEKTQALQNETRTNTQKINRDYGPEL